MKNKIAFLIFSIIMLVFCLMACGNLMNELLSEITDTPEIKTLKVVYDSNGADSGNIPVDPNLYAEGEAVTVLPNSGSLKNQGFFFTGWNTKIDGSGTNYKPGEVVVMGTAELTLYARWAAPFKMLASDGAAGDMFGWSASISGDYAVIGADENDDIGVSSGLAYVYHRSGINTWGDEFKLTASDAAGSNEFGHAVAIDGDYIVIWARGMASGPAYVYHRTGTNTWGEEFKLSIPDTEQNYQWGMQVAISGDYIVTGLDSATGNIADSGAAYVFHRTGTNSWSEGFKLQASDGAIGDSFGKTVSIYGDYVIISATGGDGLTANEGAAYIYHRTGTNTWGEECKLYSSDGESGDQYGYSVGISGDYALVSAVLKNPGGGAYIYRRTGANTWGEEYAFTSSDNESDDWFGRQVAMDGDYVIIGARQDTNEKGNFAGAGYVYHRTGTNTWGDEQKLLAPDGAAGDYFSWAVSIDNDYVLLSATQDDDNGSGSGSAWIFNYR